MSYELLPSRRRRIRTMKSFRARIEHAIAWTGATFLSRAVVNLVATATLANLVAPTAFGLLGMATAVTALLSVFGDLGIGAALIQRESVTSTLLATAFWTNLAMGFAAFVGVIAASPEIATAFREPDLQLFVCALSVTFLISSFGIVPASLMQRQFQFRELGVIETGAAVVAATAAIYAAERGAKEWSLVIQPVTGETVRVIALWTISRWRPLWSYSTADLKSVAGFSLNLTGFSLIVYISRNLDRFLIGRYLGADQLGYYALAYRILLFPLQAGIQVISRVMFSALARIQQSDAKTRELYRKMATIVSLIAFPALLGLGATAEPLVALLFGSAWRPAATLLSILSPVAALTPLAAMEGALFQAKGATRTLFRWNIVKSLILVAAVIVGLRWGIFGVATAHTAVIVILAYPAWRLCFGLVGMKVSEFVNSLRGVILPAAAMLVAMTLFDTTMLNTAPPVERFCGLVGVGIIVYGPLALWFNRNIIWDVISGSRLFSKEY